MPVTTDIDAFRQALADACPLVGLDLGTKTMGLALSDPTRTVASAHVTLKRRRFAEDAEALLALAERERAAGFVIGLPLNLDGRDGPRAQATRAFARNLAQRTALALLLWDERLSTAAVERTLIEADRSRARRAALIDKLAAAYILQGALDRLKRP